MIIGSVVLAVVVALASMRFPRRFVLPHAGLILCLGCFLGCYWLRHPGVVPGRNGVLAAGMIGAGFGMVVLLLVLFLNVCRNLENRPQ